MSRGDEEEEDEDEVAMDISETKSRGDEEEEDEDEVAMDISETKRCYVYGQCQVCSLQKMILGLVEKENV